ncbi:MAG TPA: non-heme iron oxygenase ferredoxin subunit [Dehalococcoidia bacterium]|nr:non-heme iron oxygenase ferredoxin subunit [Dehalococcoidia bacterium]
MLEGFVKVATLADLVEGEMLGVSIEGEDICIARIDGEIYAIGNRCTHAYAMLSDGEFFPEQREVQCPMHDSLFSLETGQPTCLPAEIAVPTYAVRIDGDEVLVGPKAAGG